MAKKVLVTARFTDTQKAELASMRPELEFRFQSPDKTTEEDLKSVDALIGNVDVSLLSNMAHLEWIQLNSSGADAYALPGAVPEQTVLTCSTGAYGLGISEYMVAMLLAMMKKIPGYLDAQKDGKWVNLGSVESPFGKRVLLIGCGNIGLEFAKRMRAFGCKPVGIRRRSDRLPEELDEVYGPEALAGQVALADVIAVSLPGTASCFHMLDRELLSHCKEGAYLMNVGRGNVIDTSALLDPEISGRFAGIWLDVCETEPLPDNDPLYHVPGLLLTPHITGGYHLEQTVQNIFDIAVHNLNAWCDGKDYIRLVSRKDGYSLS